MASHDLLAENLTLPHITWPWLLSGTPHSCNFPDLRTSAMWTTLQSFAVSLRYSLAVLKHSLNGLLSFLRSHLPLVETDLVLVWKYH